MPIFDPLMARFGLFAQRENRPKGGTQQLQFKNAESFGPTLLNQGGLRDAETPIEKSFHRNAVVHRCVHMISEACASIPIEICEAETQVNVESLRALLLNANGNQTGADLREILVAHLLLFGNAYLETTGTPNPEALYALRPDRIEVIADESGWPRFYDYRIGAKTRRLDVLSDTDQLIHLKMFHPQNDHYGLAPLSAAGLAIDIHNAANYWNKSLFDNAARPSGALVYRGQDGAHHLSDEQFDRLKSELETNFQGARNAGRPLLLEGGLDWASISLSPQDMDFIAAKHSAARDIALAFGVPSMLLGIPGDNTYANYTEANRAFWRQTVLPLSYKILTALEKSLSRQMPVALRLDLDAVPALSEERKKLWDRLEKASFLTRDEKRIAVGYTPLEAQDNEGLMQ